MENVIEGITGKIKDELNDIPHRVDKKKKESKKKLKQKELERAYLDHIKEEQQQNKKLIRKLKKETEKTESIQKKNEKLESRINNLEKDYKQEIKHLKRDLFESKKEMEQEQDKNKEIENLKKQIKSYQDDFNWYKEQGIDLRTIQQDLIEYKQEVSEKLDESKKREQHYKKQCEAMRRKTKRNRKQSIKHHRKQKQFKEENGHISDKLGRYKEIVREKDIEIKDLHKEVLELTRERKGNITVQDALNVIEKELTIKSVKRFGRLEKLYGTYEKLKQERYEKDNLKSIEYGYVIHQKGQILFQSVDGGKPYKVTNKFFMYVKNNAVCKVKRYRNGENIISDIYKDMKELGKYNDLTETVEQRLKTNNSKKKNDTKSVSVGEDFIKTVAPYKVLVLSSKDLKSYQTYLHGSHNNVEFISPYSEGERKVQSLIDKADIVAVRPDAVAHSVTNYLKSTAKDKTVFCYDASPNTLAVGIYTKVKELIGK